MSSAKLVLREVWLLSFLLTAVLAKESADGLEVRPAGCGSASQ